MADISTIRVHKRTKKRLEKLKVHPREPYEEVLERLIERKEKQKQDPRKNALKDFVKKIKERSKKEIEDIILYGSYARGEEGEESDVDLLIIWSGDLTKGREIAAEVETEILVTYDVLISPKLISPENYKRMQNQGIAFVENVQKEGVKIV